jgi:KUP system potassium uptake protein
MKAILGNNIINADIVLGGFHAFLDSYLTTTIKYVLITQCGQHGEGRFSLFMLWSKKQKNG